jgi:hypothetical protein
MEEGFELNCEGIMDRPLRVDRLFEAVVLATELGQDLSIEIQILDVGGATAEVIALNRPADCGGRDGAYATEAAGTSPEG